MIAVPQEPRVELTGEVDDVGVVMVVNYTAS